MSVGRKVFHCVVDDTALAANIGDIKKWTSQGAINLIVPLYTLERLHALKKIPSQTGVNARESLRFLDRVTSGKHSIPASKVVLQGPMEQFGTWAEAEKYLLPEFKEEAVDSQAPVSTTSARASIVEPAQKSAENGLGITGGIDDLNEMSQMLLSKLNFKNDMDTASANSAGTPSFPASPATASSRQSPEYAARQLGEPQRDESDSVQEDETPERVFVNPVVPQEIRPLLNATLWRLHAHPDATSAASGCVLVTNNRSSQAWAQKFGIAVKNIPQLRTSIIYEEKEFKNHCKYLEKNPTNEPKPLLSYEDESDEDVLVFVPRGQAKLGSAGSNTRTPTKASPVTPRSANSHTNGSARIKSSPTEPQVEMPSTPIDPDSFNRNFGVVKQQGAANANTPNTVSRGPPPQHPRSGGPGRRGGPRGGGMFRGTGRGRGRLWVP
ncbi:conserved hypothetical protein [Uncinocarpus reesii 1704]|uniref:PIN domain-containing protein n=1 Tax=Uncinocarpus reesii (strain UAMH 1704) TaxID=336963 RepID=C4JFP4_UNCRE|nr:uncharacterized protein UREG_02378 [Uncinocarpus reesii 1704]EEP77529.1 conserved hypothetical protein [Uncinocarpus reesii 1704]